MKLISFQDKSTKSNNSTFPRWVYDCNTHIHKIIPNGTDCLTPLEELRKNSNYLNSILGFKYIKDIHIDDQYIYMDIYKLDKSNYKHTIEDHIYQLIDIWIDTNLKIFPLCNVDLQENNVMLYKEKPIIIDWDDAIQGEEHTAFYIIAEIFRHCMSHMFNLFDNLEDKQNITEYIQQKIQSTCLDITMEQWTWIHDNFEMRGYNFEKVLHWSEIPSSWLLRND